MSTWIYVIVLDFQDNNDLITFYYINRIGILTHKGVNSYNIKVVNSIACPFHGVILKYECLLIVLIFQFGKANLPELLDDLFDIGA